MMNFSGRNACRLLMSVLLCGTVAGAFVPVKAFADIKDRTGADVIADPADMSDELSMEQMLDDDLPEININPIIAKEPKPVYFPGEEEKMKKAKAADAKRRMEPEDGEQILRAPDGMEPLRKPRKLSPEEQAELDAAAANGEDGKPVSNILEPQAAWLVGAATPNKLAPGDHSGCLALNQFNNGFIVGIHGRNNGIAGLTVDTRQAAFEEGRVYPVALSLGGNSYALMGMASDQGTIAVDLSDISNLRQQVAGIGSMRIMLGKTAVFFSTAGMAEGIDRLLECMSEEGAKTMKVDKGTPDKTPEAVAKDVVNSVNADGEIKMMEVTRSGKRVPIALAVTELIPSGYRFVIERGIDPMLPISWEKGAMWTDVLGEALTPHGLHAHVKGRLVRISYEPAPAEDMADDAMTRYAATPDDTPADAEDNAAASGDAGKAVYDKRQKWVGHSGEKLEDVLYGWSSQAGVRLVVDLESDLTLDEDYAYEGKFADAVQGLMSHFAGDPSMPVSRFKGLEAGKRPEPEALSRAPISLLGDSLDESSTASLSPRAPQIGKKESKLKTLGYLPSKNYTAVPEGFEGGTQNWFGLEGASLRDILERWCIDEGVELMWMPGQRFDLKESVRLNGGFTDAVTEVLNQFSADAVRPTAQLNNDPDTGRRALIVRAAGAKDVPSPSPSKPKK